MTARVSRRVVATAAAVGLVLASALVTAAVVDPHGGAETGRLRVAVVGDDFSAGIQNRVVWPTLMAQRTGWAVSNVALPGTGYVADGTGGQAFTYQVDRARATDADVIVIFGGLKDTGLAETGPISVGATDAINKIVLGGERALVIGPSWYQAPAPGAVTQVSTAIGDATRAAGMPYRDAADPPLLTADLMRPDFSGPTDRGQSVLADQISDWIRSEMLR